MDESKLYFWPSTFCVEGDDIWFMSGNSCLLCRHDLKTHVTEIVCRIPEKEFFAEKMFGNLIYHNQKIYLIPTWAEKIYIYKIDLKQITCIELDKYDGLKFCKAYIMGEEIVCIPYAYPDIICINTSLDEITEKINLRPIKKNNGIDYFNSAEIYDCNIAIVSPNSNKVFVYDATAKEMTSFCPIIGNNGYTSVTFIMDELILGTNGNNRLYFYNINDANVRTINLPTELKGIVLHSIDSRLIIDDPFSPIFWIYTDKDGFIKHVQTTVDNKGDSFAYKYGVFDKNSNLYFDNCALAFQSNIMENNFLRMEVTEELQNQITELVRKCVENVKSTNENIYWKLDDYINMIVEK